MTGQSSRKRGEILTPQGQVIEGYERETHLSLNKLADKAGITRETLSRIKGGKSGGEPETFEKLAAALTKILDREINPDDVRVTAEAEPEPGSPYDRLLSLEDEVLLWREVLREALTLLDLQVDLEADPGSRVSRRNPRRRPAGGGRG